MLRDLNKTFSENPVSLDMSRSRFTLNQTHKTTLSEGDLVPVYIKEVLPGDTFSVDTALLVRMATPIFPVMDNSFLDLYYFYVPNRIVWEHWQEFLGENTTAPWTQQVEYNIPQITFNREWDVTVGDGESAVHRFGYAPLKGSVMNYMGVPTSICPVAVGNESVSFSVSDLPNRAYRLIWNEFFRDENLQTPVPVYKDDSNRAYYDSNAEFSGQSESETGFFYNYGGRPLKVNKFHDYFTSCLPAPQKGPSVPVGIFNSGAPVYATSALQSLSSSDVAALHFAHHKAGEPWVSTGLGRVHDIVTDSVGNTRVGGTSGVVGSDDFYTPDNLWADLNAATFATVNSLREAFAIQRFYEASARGGTRYREILRAFFGVTAPDARVQVPEYLGGKRVHINMDQVLQTSSSDDVSPQGNTAAYSLTTDVSSSFTKSFVEHGLVIGLACVRVEHTYAQSVEPFWFRKRRFDFYFPQFANLGEQPVYKKYLVSTGISSYDNSVFGYQEAWADYRFSPNRISGEFSPDLWVEDHMTIVTRNSSLADAWTYNDYYPYNVVKVPDDADDLDLSSLPSLSDEWIREDNANVAQTIATPSEPQFIADFRFNVTATRPMPVRSIPGLIDHH